MAETTSTGKLELLAKSFGWPLVAIAFMALFFGPISKWLGGLGKASEITVGALGIKFDSSASAALTADAETADAVSKLTPDQLDFLLAHPFGQVTVVCAAGNFNAKAPDVFKKKDLDEPANWASLETFGLASSRANQPDNLEFCNPGSMKAYELTDKGNIVRTYVSHVATQLLKFEKKG